MEETTTTDISEARVQHLIESARRLGIRDAIDATADYVRYHRDLTGRDATAQDVLKFLAALG